MQEATKLGDLIDAMYDLREEKRLVEAQLKTITEQLDNFDRAIRAKLEELGTTMARGQRGSASLSEQEIYKIDDATAFFQYVAENEAWHLVQRRPASNSVAELYAMGTEVPGISHFTKKSISLRKV